MATASIVQRHEPEELLSREKDGPRLELIDGQFVEKPPMGAQADRILARLIFKIEQFSEAPRLGQTFTGSCGYQIFRDDPKRVRYPDGSFVCVGRLPGEAAPPGHMKIPRTWPSRSSRPMTTRRTSRSGSATSSARESGCSW